MIQRGTIILCFALIWFGLVSCQRVRNWKSTERELEAIPAEYGDLIGVTSRSDDPSWTQVWFMKPDKSVVVVFVNAARGRILDTVVTIPRR